MTDASALGGGKAAWRWVRGSGEGPVSVQEAGLALIVINDAPGKGRKMSMSVSDGGCHVGFIARHCAAWVCPVRHRCGCAPWGRDGDAEERHRYLRRSLLRHSGFADAWRCPCVGRCSGDKGARGGRCPCGGLYQAFGGREDPGLGVRIGLLGGAVLVFSLMNFVPVLGWMMNFLLVLFGIGALSNGVLRTLVARLPQEHVANQPPPPVALG
jgi:hypothetical protein